MSDPDALARYEAAGLDDPGAPDADERLALLEYLAAEGGTFERMLELDALGRLPSLRRVAAPPGTVLVTREVRDGVAAAAPGLRFTSAGYHALRGFEHAVELFGVQRAPHGSA